MDIATLLGILSGLGLIVGAIAMGSGLGGFIDLPSIAIVGGGTMASTLVMFPWNVVLGSIKVGMKAFTAKSPDEEQLIQQIIKLADTGRREGLLALEKAQVDNDFLRRGVRLVADGSAPNLVRAVMETEIDFMKQRHRRGQSVFKGMGAMAPAFGMIGTLVGLVQMLQNMADPSSIGSAMAVALLTTFYGAVASNVIFLPMAKKLEERSNEEAFYMAIIVDGVMAIQNGENPRVVQERLQAFLAPSMRTEK
ncbi:MotA/TolQ/ExbB proton channel family protein [Desulfocurvibacter africanus]|uniref:motility protein A n=1 Tax=Desulfocurvibacter africanus TaxID=873 RepID=UPI002FD9C535